MAKRINRPLAYGLLAAAILSAAILTRIASRDPESAAAPGAVTRQVRIWADGQLHSILSDKTTPAEYLLQAGLEVESGDLILLNGEVVAANMPLADLETAPALQILRAASLIVHEGAQAHELRASVPTLAEALWQGGIRLLLADRLAPAAETNLIPQSETLEVSLTRSRPLLVASVDGLYAARTTAATVGEALLEIGLPLQGLDYSQPAADQPLPDDGEVRVVHVSEELILEQEPIQFEILYQPAPDVEIDTLQAIQAGSFGVLARSVRVRYEDGVEISRQVSGEWQAAAPQPRIVGYGTKIVVRTIETPAGTLEYWRAVPAFATSYSPCRLGTGSCGNTTASGLPLQKGLVGVIRSWYNAMVFSEVYVAGYGVATIADIGAGVSGQHWIDLGYSDDDWVSWAANVTIYFLTPVPPVDQILWILP